MRVIREIDSSFSEACIREQKAPPLVVAGGIDMRLLVDFGVFAEPVVDAYLDGLILDHAAAGAPVVPNADQS